jgi:rubrerythrin
MGQFYFSIYEIAAMAMDIEETGAQFYASLAGATQDEALIKIFLTLSSAESQHKKTFQDIAASFQKGDRIEYSVNLPALIQANIDKIKEAAFSLALPPKGPLDIRKALAIAIHTEEVSIRVYTDMADIFAARFREIIDSLIQEEQKHLAILNKIRQDFAGE